jgi:hypothetical protein
MVMLALVLAIPQSTHAQGTASANLNGTVYNCTGAVVPDADDLELMTVPPYVPLRRKWQRFAKRSAAIERSRSRLS